MGLFLDWQKVNDWRQISKKLKQKGRPVWIEKYNFCKCRSQIVEERGTVLINNQTYFDPLL